MDKNIFIATVLVSLLIIICESRIIARGLPKDGSSGNGEIPLSANPLENDAKLGLGPGMWGPPAESDDFGGYDYDSGVNDPQRPPTDYDINKPEEDEIRPKNNKPDKKPERYPSNEDRLEPPLEKPVGKDEDVDKKYHKEKPREEDEPGNKNDDSNKDDEFPPDEKSDKSIPTDGDDSNVVEETGDKEDSSEKDSDEKEGEDEDKKDNIPDADENADKFPKDDNEESEEHDKDEDDNEESEEHDKDEDDNEESEEPDKDEDDEEKSFDGEEAGFIDSGGSIFDTPFFNLEQVKKYFSTLDRALGHVFRQTMDEARLLNGTYANTTEEEVEIDGKKYVVQKSLIQGADNHSSIYVEALSSIPKVNGSEEAKSKEITNSTEA